MRISRRELDSSVLKKLDQFDSITNLPYVPSDGFVSYKKDVGFFFKKTNDSFLRKIYSEDDFIEMKNAVYNPPANVKSSAYFDMREDKDRYSAAVSSLVVDGEFDTVLSSQENIRIVKNDVNRFIALDVAGNVIETLGNEVKYSVNVLSLLKDSFSLNELGAFDITDIELYPNGFLVSILESGVYKYDSKTGVIEMVIADNGIKMIKVISENKKLFCVSDNACTVYMIDSGKKIETFHTIKNAFQIPFIMSSEGRDIFIVGKTMIRNSDKLIHLWREDAAKINYNNKDNLLSTHKSASKYEIKFISQDKNYLYISGLYRNKLFVWKYDKDYLYREPEEVIMDCLDFSKMTGVVCINNQYLVAVQNKLYGIQDNIVCMNVSFENPIAKLFFTEVGVIAISNENVLNISLPKFTAAQDELKYLLLNEREECNNIDIFIAGANNGEIVTLLNSENKEIIPTAIFHNRGDIMIKLMNCPERVINMKIKVFPESSITGIAVKKNKLFIV